MSEPPKATLELEANVQLSMTILSKSNDILEMKADLT